MIGSLSVPQTHLEPLSLKTTDTMNTGRSTADTKTFGNIDHVSISSEGLRKQRETSSESEGITWESLLDLENGSSTLSNGNIQEVTIDGSHIEISEYSGNRLMGKIEGDLGLSRANLNTERYDVLGRLEQSMQMVLTGLSDTVSTKTNATMTRSVCWYDSGRLSRSMDDSLELKSSYTLLKNTKESLAAGYYEAGKVNDKSSFGASGILGNETLNQLQASLTQDSQQFKYHAAINDYSHGRLVQDMTIHQESMYTSETNRSSASSNGTASSITNEMYHDTSLRVHLTSYDSDGNVQREALFSDEQKGGDGSRGGKTTQSLSISWYNEGELVRRSEGSLELEESESMHIGSRPTMLETLGITNGEFASSTPQSAGELLSCNYMEAATDPGCNVGTLKSYANKSVSAPYNPAERLSEIGDLGRPYSVSWTDEMYQNGEMTVRRENSESARRAPDSSEMRVRPGVGLTEDDTSELLHKSSHTVESHENGRIQTQTHIEAHETLEQENDGPCQLTTHISTQQGTGMHSQATQKDIDGSLLEADANFHAATESCASVVGMILDDMVDTINAVEGPLLTS